MSGNSGALEYPDRTFSRGEFRITTDKAALDIAAAHAALTRTYWAEGMPRETLERAVRNCLCYGVFHGSRQVGFARVVTDYATFAYLTDVYVQEEYRGRGLSKWLMECILAHEGLRGLRRLCLATRDAHGLYQKFGFAPLQNVSRWMEIFNPSSYKKD